MQNFFELTEHFQDFPASSLSMYFIFVQYISSRVDLYFNCYNLLSKLICPCVFFFSPVNLDFCMIFLLSISKYSLVDLLSFDNGPFFCLDRSGCLRFLRSSVSPNVPSMDSTWRLLSFLQKPQWFWKRGNHLHDKMYCFVEVYILESLRPLNNYVADYRRMENTEAEFLGY